MLIGDNKLLCVYFREENEGTICISNWFLSLYIICIHKILLEKIIGREKRENLVK